MPAASAGAAVSADVSALALAALPGVLVALGHALFGAWLVARSRRVDPSSPPSLATPYLLLWKSFHAQSLPLPRPPAKKTNTKQTVATFVFPPKTIMEKATSRHAGIRCRVAGKLAVLH